ncbi:Protein BREAST CANCER SUSCEPTIBILITY 1-like protein [Diplonema papillatum]|nr:Protein BREAST CANCER SUSCEPTIBILITY 1-like protein [Diplonema papillatum]
MATFSQLPAETGVTTQDLEDLKTCLKCKVCTFLFTEPVALPCGHVFCNACALQNLSISRNCPLCRGPYTRRSVYPVARIADICTKLTDLGENLGVDNIEATQCSQPLVFKPFVPLQRLPVAGDVMSQYLREHKSQLPLEQSSASSDDESSDTTDSAPAAPPRRQAPRTPPPPAGKKRVAPASCDGGEAEPLLLPTCPQGCPLKLSNQKSRSWLCANAAGGRGAGGCAGKMAKKTVRAGSYVCRACNYTVCTACYNKAAQAEPQAGRRAAKKRRKPAPQEKQPTQSEEGGSSDEGEYCELCNVAADQQTEGLTLLLKRIAEKGNVAVVKSGKQKRPRNGVLWKADAKVMNQKLGGLEGPFPVTWRKGSKRMGHKLTRTLRKDVRAHDLCLLWCPQTRTSPDGATINPRTVAPAVRNARNRSCHACALWGASILCRHPGCSRAFHIPCGLFTAAVGEIDPENFTALCQEHAGDTD